MANLITTCTDRIESYRKENKTPCKNYATQAAAEKATAAMAKKAGEYFGTEKEADYLVFFIEPWGRWVGCICLTELLRRPEAKGGYLGICTGFFTY